MARIVIVDDDEVLTEIVASLLREDGHRVIAVHHGDEAMDTIQNCDPDLVILDQALPGKSGMRILQELRELPMALNLPVMMLTSRASRLHIELADQGGADDYVAKPFDANDLTAKVRALLKGADISRAAGADAPDDETADRSSPDQE